MREPRSSVVGEVGLLLLVAHTAVQKLVEIGARSLKGERPPAASMIRTTALYFFTPYFVYTAVVLRLEFQMNRAVVHASYVLLYCCCTGVAYSSIHTEFSAEQKRATSI